MTIPKISIVIVTWNTAKITLNCVKTVNKFLVNPEIIVVDNGSEDDTIKLLSKEKNIKIIQNRSNLGFAKANNIGFMETTSDYVVFMNSDIELIDKSITKMIDYIRDNPKIGLIGPMFLNTDFTPQASVFPPQTIVNAFKEFWLGKKGTYSKYIPKNNKPTRVNYISGGCIVVNKDFFKKIELWNEKYFFYYEDMDLCRQVTKNDKDIVFYPKCKIIHRHGSSGVKLTDSQNQWRRLIPSSKKYHGLFKHYLINFIIWSGQKINKLIKILF